MLLVAYTNVIGKGDEKGVRFWVYSEVRANMLTDWMTSRVTPRFLD